MLRLAERGMMIGKFLPPHAGHIHLAQFAGQLVDDLTIVLCSLPGEPISGALRERWLRELFPRACIVHLDEELPSSPEQHPDFWTLWEAALRRVIPAPPDLVFASETYGHRLAAVLGADFVPLDLEREAQPVSGSRVRGEPFGFWEQLPACVRAHYAARICVFGPESTGKSTLAGKLAHRFHTCWVPEYARTHLEQRNGKLEEPDLLIIARGQRASEESLARLCNRLLIGDTDVLSTSIWARELYDRCDPRIEQLAEHRPADLYLLCDVDVPWVADQVRYLPEGRRTFFNQFRIALDRRGLPYCVVSGHWEQRLETAVDAIVRRWPMLRHPTPSASVMGCEFSEKSLG